MNSILRKIVPGGSVLAVFICSVMMARAQHHYIRYTVKPDMVTGGLVFGIRLPPGSTLKECGYPSMMISYSHMPVPVDTLERSLPETFAVHIRFTGGELRLRPVPGLQVAFYRIEDKKRPDGNGNIYMMADMDSIIYGDTVPPDNYYHTETPDNPFTLKKKIVTTALRLSGKQPVHKEDGIVYQVINSKGDLELAGRLTGELIPLTGLSGGDYCLELVYPDGRSYRLLFQIAR